MNIKRPHKKSIRNKLFLLAVFIFFSSNLLMAQKVMYVSSGNGINLREGAGANHKVTATIPGGHKLQVIRTDGDWSQVEYQGKTGYVSSKYLTEDNPGNGSSSNDSRSIKSSSSSHNPNSSPSNFPPSWGVGIRFGEPFGLTIKKYIANEKALEFKLGSTGYYGFDYKDDFYERYENKEFEYLNYDRSSAVSLQAHYLFQKDFPKATGLQWYWGVGPQIRFMTNAYSYRFKEYYGPGEGDFIWGNNQDKVTHIDIGVDAIIGLEYHFAKAPLSIFGDINISIEILDNPLYIFGQGGLGIRYNIK